ALDHLGDTLQGPHVIRVAVGFGAFDQLTFDLNELVSAQLWQPPSATRSTQSVSPRPAPGVPPVGHDLMRDTHLPWDLGWNHPLLEQVSGAQTPFLHRGEIASRPDPRQCRLAPALLYRNIGHA